MERRDESELHPVRGRARPGTTYTTASQTRGPHLSRRSYRYSGAKNDADREAESPWAGREGWLEEATIFIRYVQRKKDDGEVPVEPGHELYNELVSRRHSVPSEPLRWVPSCRPEVRPRRLHDPTEDGFHNAIAYELFTVRGEPIPHKELDVAIAALIGRARSRSLPSARVVRLSLRVAAENGISRIDLADEARRCVAVGPDGWAIESIRHPMFDQRLSMLALPEPKRAPAGAGDRSWRQGLDRLWEFVLLPPAEDRDDQRLLALTVLVHFLISPRSPKPIAVFGGEEGIGKSSSSEKFQAVVDPSLQKIIGPDILEDPKELFALVVNHAVVNFDNVSWISSETSDQLARLSTGVGFAKREVLHQLRRGRRRCLPAGDPERHLFAADCTRPSKPRDPFLGRRTRRPNPQGAARPELGRAHPEILGGLLDLVAETARVLRDNPPPPHHSRMADFCTNRSGRCLRPRSPDGRLRQRLDGQLRAPRSSRPGGSLGLRSLRVFPSERPPRMR